MLQSLPAWGAWVEIIINFDVFQDPESLPAWGAWVEIHRPCSKRSVVRGRSPHGERGLK